MAFATHPFHTQRHARVRKPHAVAEGVERHGIPSLRAFRVTQFPSRRVTEFPTWSTRRGAGAAAPTTLVPGHPSSDAPTGPPGREERMAGRSLVAIDVTEIMMHWYAGRPKAEVARCLGIDPKTVRKYVCAARAAGLVPGGPPVSPEQWAAHVRMWFPELVAPEIRFPTFSLIGRRRARRGGASSRGAPRPKRTEAACARASPPETPPTARSRGSSSRGWRGPPPSRHGLRDPRLPARPGRDRGPGGGGMTPGPPPRPDRSPAEALGDARHPGRPARSGSGRGPRAPGVPGGPVRGRDRPSRRQVAGGAGAPGPVRGARHARGVRLLLQPEGPGRPDPGPRGAAVRGGRPLGDPVRTGGGGQDPRGPGPGPRRLRARALRSLRQVRPGLRRARWRDGATGEQTARAL